MLSWCTFEGFKWVFKVFIVKKMHFWSGWLTSLYTVSTSSLNILLTSLEFKIKLFSKRFHHKYIRCYVQDEDHAAKRYTLMQFINGWSVLYFSFPHITGRRSTTDEKKNRLFETFFQLNQTLRIICWDKQLSLICDFTVENVYYTNIQLCLKSNTQYHGSANKVFKILKPP